MYNIDYINIFEGSYTDGGALAQLVYRGSYKCAGDFVLRRDLTQLVKSEARVIDDNKSIQPFDIIEFWFQDLRRFGRVVDVEREDNVTKLTFIYGMDSHTNDFEVFNNRKDFRSFYYDNHQAIAVSSHLDNVTNPQYTVETDGVLGVDVILRQMARRRYVQEVYIGDFISDGFFSITSVDMLDDSITKLRLDDKRLGKVDTLRIGRDKITRVVLYDNEDTTHYQSYQLMKEPLPDGSMDIQAVSGDGRSYIMYDTYQSPQILKVQTASTDNYLDIDYAKDIFRQSEYDNEIVISVPIDNDLFSLGYLGIWETYDNVTIDTLLGKKYELYYPDTDISVVTRVSAYEIDNTMMKITFGMTRTRLSDILNKVINKD